MEIICNSPASVIRSKKSSDIIAFILKELCFENADEILCIFNKVKTLIPIDNEDKNKILDFIESDNFRTEYEKIQTTFIVNQRKIQNIDFNNLIISFHHFITKSRVIEILEKNGRETLFENKKKYLKIRKNNNKFLYLEIIEEKGNYSLWTDIRSWKYKIVNNIDNILLETKEKIIFDWDKDFTDLGSFLIWDWDYNYFCSDNFSIHFSKNSHIHNSKYEISIIDPKFSIIHQIDKKTNRLSIIHISWDILDIKKWYILYFINCLWYKWPNNEKITTEWSLNVYSCEKNKEVIHNIHHKYYELSDEKFIWLSFDLSCIYIFDFTFKKLKTINIDEIDFLYAWLSSDMLWIKILEKFSKK